VTGCRTVFAAACLFAGGFVTGCTDASSAPHQTSADRALADPANYGPKPGKTDTTTGKSGDPFDKDGLKKDLDHVFNP
jgi:hypothetical protein